MSSANSRGSNGIVFRRPDSKDGKKIYQLAKDSGTLDLNSTYHYLLFCRCFSQSTSVAQSDDGKLAGFCTGFVMPDKPDTFFAWQLAVDSLFRGKGIGSGLVLNILENLQPIGIKQLQATITASNTASINLFKSVAGKLKAPYSFDDVFFSGEDFGKQQHEAEKLFQIGPIDFPQ